jgi:hypothetical protein
LNPTDDHDALSDVDLSVTDPIATASPTLTDILSPRVSTRRVPVASARGDDGDVGHKIASHDDSIIVVNDSFDIDEDDL